MLTLFDCGLGSQTTSVVVSSSREQYLQRMPICSRKGPWPVLDHHDSNTFSVQGEEVLVVTSKWVFYKLLGLPHPTASVQCRFNRASRHYQHRFR